MQSDKNKKGDYSLDPSKMRKKPDEYGPVAGVNTPNIEVPAFNPPVPNRAWTEMAKKDNMKMASDKKESNSYNNPEELI